MFGHVGNKLVLLGETIDMCDELPSMTYKVNDCMSDGYLFEKFALLVDS